MKEIFLTAEEIAQKKARLDKLITELLPKVRDDLRVARAQGDLSENGEYDEAKNEFKKLDAERQTLEEELKVAKLIDINKIDTTVVGDQCVVKFKDLKSGLEYEFKIVAGSAAKYADKKISNESPIGAALLGHKVDDVVEVRAPAGTYQYKILNISK